MKSKHFLYISAFASLISAQNSFGINVESYTLVNIQEKKHEGSMDLNEYKSVEEIKQAFGDWVVPHSYVLPSNKIVSPVLYVRCSSPSLYEQLTQELLGKINSKSLCEGKLEFILTYEYPTGQTHPE